MQTLSLSVIARIHSEFPQKFGIPRQSGLVPELEATVVFEPPYRDPEALRGLEDFSHLWLLWHFSQTQRRGWWPTVRPPRLGGNVRMGVFATRSPFRPNPLGLSCVRLKGIGQDSQLGPLLYVSGADLMDDSPIFDIKPYLPYADCHPQATAGFAAQSPLPTLRVNCPSALLNIVSPKRRQALLALLAYDPRPAYQKDSRRAYGLTFAGCHVRFTVQDDVLTVEQIKKD